MDKSKESDPVKALRELGIYFDENGKLCSVKNNDLITMNNLSVDPMLVVAAITHYVQMKMIMDYSFEEIAIPLSTDCTNSARSSIFGTKGCLVSETLLVVIPSSGTYPGIWSRSLCFNDGLLKGSMLPFFHHVMQTNMGIIVLNPYVNSYKLVDSKGQFSHVSIPHNETPENHILYIWDRIISRTSAKNLVILAYGQGGSLAKSLLQSREESVLLKLRAIAFTQSLHTLQTDLSFSLNVADSKGIRTVLERHAINWMVSDVTEGQRVYEEEEPTGCLCVSAVPAACNAALLHHTALSAIFSFFQRSCSDHSLSAQKYWEEQLRGPDETGRGESSSDTMTSTNEVIKTSLPVCSNWVPDGLIEECQVCLIPFSFLVRKHHCRSCGRVVCSMCSKYRMLFKNQETPYRACCSCYFDVRKDLPNTSSPSSPLTLSDFQLLRVVGRGSFGKVLLVRNKRDQHIYALKILSKSHIVARNQIEHTISERKILAEIDHPFLCRLEFAFQSDDKLYLGMQFMAGGPLFFHLQQCRRFSEERARFYSAEVILGIEYLHKHNILYRDMKPENLLLDRDGHVVITDFGLSKQTVEGSAVAQTICGTPEYVAPEVLSGHAYDKSIDWWSVGTLLYEMIGGIPPFYDKNRKVMFSKIMTAKLRFSVFFSVSACNLISRLLDRNPTSRLGSGIADAEEIKTHPFFSGFDWSAVQQKRIAVPWKPSLVGETDTSYFNHKYTYADIDETAIEESSNSDLPNFPNFAYQKDHQPFCFVSFY